MQTMTNYPGYPRGGWMVARALAGAGAVIGWVAVLATAAPAAPDASVTITERTAAQLAAVRHTAKPAKSMTELQPSAFILETATRRLHQSDGAARTPRSGGQGGGAKNQEAPRQGTKAVTAKAPGSAPPAKAVRVPVAPGA